MQEIKMDQRRQSRRAHALARFPIKNIEKQLEIAAKEKRDSDVKHYTRRKEEFEFLKSRVGGFTPRTFDSNDSPKRTRH